ncbi:MAG: glutaredoxin family protein [Acidobacteria bacterium]|nr:glutaredoxin family protein [Acidobacteriota bacterium]
MTEYLSRNGIAFEAINIRTDPGVIDELVARRVTATPALVFDDELIVGFDRERIDRAIEAMRGRAEGV